MKFKKLESYPEKGVTFGSLPRGTEFVLGLDNERVYMKTSNVTRHYEGMQWDCNSVCLFDGEHCSINNSEPVKIVECVLEYKVVR